MQTVTMEEAKAQLPELIEAAANGEPFVIMRQGQRLVSVTVAEVHQADELPLSSAKAGGDAEGALATASGKKTIRTFGTMAGQIKIPDDFDRYMEDEILEMFGLND